MKPLRCRVFDIESTSPLKYRYFEDAVLIVRDGRIIDLGPASRFENEGMDLTICDWHPDELIVPGLIDTHVHSPQIDIIGSCGEQLLDWLQRYTFPAEARFVDEAYAFNAANDFVEGLLRAGTTSAMVFATSHLQATDALFEAAFERNMRMIAGKVLMDQNAPAALLDTAIGGAEDSARLIEKWHGRGRLGYAVTPRFAGSSTDAQLAAAGRLHQMYPDTWIQTHLSENLDEIAWVAELHPASKDYLNIYERHGLVNDRAFFGHCLHLTDDEVGRMATAGAKAAFCPSSNLFLGSGLLDKDRLLNSNVALSLATDVGAGTSLSMFRTMGDAYKVCQMQGQSFGAIDAISLATLGNAEALGLDQFVGNFQPGKEADFVSLRPQAGSIIARRAGLATDIEEELFVYMTLGDESIVKKTYVSGECLWEAV